MLSADRDSYFGKKKRITRGYDHWALASDINAFLAECCPKWRKIKNMISELWVFKLKYAYFKPEKYKMQQELYVFSTLRDYISLLQAKSIEK